MANNDEKGKLTSLKIILSIIFFALSYAIIFFVGSAGDAISKLVGNIPVLSWFLPIPSVIDPPGNPITQVSMMHLLLPFVGFWLVFILIGWINDYFETKHGKTIAFPIIFICFSLAAFFISLYWAATETAVLNSVALNQIIPDFWAYFWGEWKSSAFYLFMLGGLFGWLFRVIVEKINL